MTKDDGGPAFPLVTKNQRCLPSGQGIGPVELTYYLGMSLRDWFAGQALAGYCANNDWLKAIHGEDDPDGLIADAAYGTADAMLAERAK